MCWSKKGVSGFAVQTQANTRFSIISAVSENDIELMTISKSNTNRIVFFKFFQLLVEFYRKSTQTVMIN